MGYTDGQPADSTSPNKYFFDFIQVSVFPSNQTKLSC